MCNGADGIEADCGNNFDEGDDHDEILHEI
jgi:hypothetical protein